MTPRLGRAAWIVAIAAGLLHMAPYWHAQAAAPDGWTFTGNIHSSPDFVQYRSWPRQAVLEGPVITDRFTSEVNRAHLPVFFYWGIGLVSDWTSVSPEWVFAYSGALFAAGLTLLIILTVRLFVPRRDASWWIVGAIMLGGGLGAHAKLAKAAVGLFAGQEVAAGAEARVSGGDVSWMWFEDYRGHYIINTIFDTHFLLIWIAAMGAVLALWQALRRPDGRSLTWVSLAFAFATVLHLYEGPTLLAIAYGITFLRAVKGLPVRRAVTVSGVLTAVVAFCLAPMVLLQRASGLPMPHWAAFTIPVTILVAAYPLAWALMAWGGGRFWRDAGDKEVFLLGWALGCTVVTLSGPFYPYPDRGTMTLQVVLTIIAGSIWFTRRRRVTPLAALVAVALLGATPVFELDRLWGMGSFSERQPHKFLVEAHADVVGTFETLSSPFDLLVTEARDVLWLGPSYPGRFYCGHFFLTVDFEGKCMEVGERLDGDWSSLRAFLDEHSARFVFTGRERAVRMLSSAPGVVPLGTSSSGTLFEYEEVSR